LTPAKNILIICFSFPPFPGIGGRRWAKFAKYLSQEGFNIHVLAAQNETEAVSEWTKDIKHPNIKTHTIPLGLSGVFSFYPKNIFEKIIYKLLSWQASLRIKGNKQDKIYFIRKKLFSTADKIIKEHKIETVIVTIPPYKLAYYILPLKKSYPGIKFIVDYRDPWTDNKSYHGFADIEKERLAREIEYEKEVLEAADIVFDVNEESLELLKNKAGSKSKFIHLPNGFDKDDYALTSTVNKNNSIRRFIYSGSFYPNLIYLLEPMIETVLSLKRSHPQLYKNLRFDFYGNMDHQAIELLNRLNCEAFKFHGNIPHSKVVEEIKGSDYCMLFAASDHSHAFNTKFYEYLFLQKPVIYFGNKGKTAQFLLEHRAGLTFDPNELKKEFYEFLISLREQPARVGNTATFEEFDVKIITKKLIRAIHD
jgi:hypothetical protein